VVSTGPDASRSEGRPMSPGKRKRLPPEERKEQLLKAALDVFCERGVDGTTMHQLAEHAGVSYGLFYHYFHSKDDVLATAARQTSVLPQMQKFLSQHDRPVKSLLKELSSYYLEIMEERREIVWLLFSESRKRPTLAEKLSEVAVDFRATLREYLAARLPYGEIREGIDLDVATRLIWSYLFMRFLWIEEEPDVELHMAILLEGLCP